MKKILAKFAIAAMVLTPFVSVLPALAAAPTSSVSGSWVIAFDYLGTAYPHDMTLAQDGAGNLTGSGGNPVGANVYMWSLISGSVSGNTIDFNANYTATPDAVTPQTTMHVVGTIAGNGTMSGTWTDNYQGGSRGGTWVSTSGAATPIAPTPTTVVVSGNTSAGENLPGWMFNRDASTATPYVFDTTAASIGAGSLHVLPIGPNASDKMVAENFINTPISNVNSISYDFKIAGSGVDTNEEQFYMGVYANFGVSDDLKFYDCRYDVIPTVGSTASFTTVTFDPTQAYPVTTRGSSPFACPATPAGMDLLSAGSNIRAIAINVGDTSTSDVGIGGYLDKVVTNLDSAVTTYDFDPVPADTTPPAVPTHVSPADNSFKTTANQLLIDWSDVTDPSAPVTYVYQASNSAATNPDGSFVSPVYTSVPLAVSQIATGGTPEGVYYWHVKAVDAANNGSAWSSAWKITVDNTAPSITLTTPVNGATYAQNQVVNANYSCTDALSGIASCVGDAANGSPINTSTQGGHSFTVTATDNSGNVTVQMVNYTVTAPVVVIATTKDQCMNGNWKTHTDGTKLFKNQGDCVSFVATKGKNTSGL